MVNSAKELIYDRFITPTQKSRTNYIGIEIEMPIVNLKGTKNDKAFCIDAVTKAIHHFAFTPVKADNDGICYEAICKDTGDIFSFDCSFNNFEISLGKVRTLHEAQARFKDYVSYINAVLNQQEHTLTGLGIHPNYKINDFNFISSPRYKMLEGYLKKSTVWQQKQSFHAYYGYGTFSSASQVQLDVSENTLCNVIKAFSLAEPLKAVLFANSYLPDRPQWLCSRDFLWENSTHGINAKNVGFFEPLPQTVDELIEYLCKTSIFCTERDGKYLFFYPIPFEDYLKRDCIEGEYYDGKYHTCKFTPQKEDIAYLRTYKQIDLTARGTLEFRSACTQPLSQAMTVAVFHLGLMHKTDELIQLLTTSFLYQNGETPAQLRQKMNRTDFLSFTNPDKLKVLLNDVLQLCSDGLQKRGYSEEIYLKPLLRRAETLTSPAVYLLQNNTEKVIKEYASL